MCPINNISAEISNVQALLHLIHVHFKERIKNLISENIHLISIHKCTFFAKKQMFEATNQ